MPGKLAALLLLLLLFAAASPQGLAQESWLDRGTREYASGQYVAAIQSLQTAVSHDPSNGLAHYSLANALLKIGHTQHALQEYSLACTYSQSSEMTRNCATVLRTYGAQVPVPMGAPKRVLLNKPMDAPTVTGLQEMNSLAGRGGAGQVSQTESHPGDSVKVFKQAPGSDPAWATWIQNFRVDFGQVLARGIRRLGTRLSGRVRMVFSVDKDHRLRGRILDTDAPGVINQTVLACTRYIDGRNELSFPPGATIDGFNFSMSYDWGPPQQPRQLDNNTMAEMQRQKDEVTARMMQQQREEEQTATQVVAQETTPAVTSKNVSANIQPKHPATALKAKPSGVLDTQQTSASLASKHVSAVIAHTPRPHAYHATAGHLAHHHASGVLSQQEVSGMLLPKVEAIGLKATQQTLDSMGH